MYYKSVIFAAGAHMNPSMNDGFLHTLAPPLGVPLFAPVIRCSSPSRHPTKNNHKINVWCAQIKNLDKINELIEYNIAKIILRFILYAAVHDSMVVGVG